MNDIEVKEIERELIAIKTQAMSLQVVDNQTYLQAGEYLKAFKGLERKIKDYFKPLKDASHKAWRNICDRENEEIEKLKPTISYLNSQMVTYNQEQERLRREEAERLRREAEKLAEERKLQAAIEAENAGYKEEAEAILDEPVFIPPPIVAKEIPKIAGQAVVKTWKWRLIDINLVPRQYLKVDEVAVNGIARSLKEKAQIPGIEFYPEMSMRGVRER